MSSAVSLVRLGNSPNWYVQWFDQETGHSKRRSTGTSRRDEAEAFQRAFELELQATPTQSEPINGILDWYLAVKDSSDRAALCAKHLKDFFGSTDADALTYQKQEAYVANRRRKVKDETIRRELSVLSAALRLAVNRQRLTSAPPVLTLPKAPPRDRWLTRDEAAKLLRHLRKNKRATHLLLFTRLALYTGARTGAILDLTWDRVDFRRRLIRYHVPGEAETNKRRPIVPFDVPLERALKAAHRRNQRRKGGPVDHVIHYGGQCERIVRGFTRNAKDAGLKGVTPHTLRHTCATWGAMSGTSLFLLGRMLGHSTQAMTDRYAKHDPEALRAAVRGVRRK